MCMVSLWKTIRSTIFLESRKAIRPQYVGNGPDVIQHLPFLVAAVCVLFRPGRFQLH